MMSFVAFSFIAVGLARSTEKASFTWEMAEREKIASWSAASTAHPSWRSHKFMPKEQSAKCLWRGSPSRPLFVNTFYTQGTTHKRTDRARQNQSTLPGLHARNSGTIMHTSIFKVCTSLGWAEPITVYLSIGQRLWKLTLLKLFTFLRISMSSPERNLPMYALRGWIHVSGIGIHGMMVQVIIIRKNIKKEEILCKSK